MSVSKKQQEYVERYKAKTYDRVNLNVKKGHRDKLKSHAAIYDGGSVNAFINRAIRETMERDLKKS